MPQTKCKIVYKFEELETKAKEKAISHFKDINTDFDWWDFVYEDVKTIAFIIGIEIENIYFSGFWSQGDGATFEGFYSYKKESVKKIKEYAPQEKELHSIVSDLFELQKKNFFSIRSSIKHHGRYSHENSNIIESENAITKNLSEEDQEEIKNILRSFMKWIYKQLNNEYDSLSTDEATVF